MVLQIAAQQPVDPVALALEVGAQVRDQHQVGLARLDHEARGHGPLVEVPGVLGDVGLDKARLAARLPDDSLGRLSEFGLQLGNDDLGALPRENLSGGARDPRARPGNERYLVL